MKHLIFIFLLTGCASAPLLVTEPTGTDVHVHIHNNSGDDMKFTGERYLLALEAANLERAVVLSHSYTRFNNPECWKTKKCQYNKKWVRATNQWTLDQAKQFPQLIPFCGIDASAEENLEDEILFCKAAGAQGLKIHLQAVRVKLTEAKTRQQFEKIAKVAGENGLIILVHAGLQDPEEANALFEIAKSHSKTTFVFAHILGRNFAMLAQNPLPNVYVEVSAAVAMLRHKKSEVVDSLRKFGIERVLFGSDWPVYHPTETLTALRSLGFSEHELSKIVSENSSRLFP